MHIAILTFQGFNELDSFIALGVLNRVKRPGWRVSICCPQDEVTSMNGVTVRAQSRLEDAADADAVIIGSGSRTREIVEDAALMARIRLDPGRQWIGAQCSGTLVLARLGLVTRLRACTDLTTRPWVQAAGVEVLEQPLHADGPVATAGGCLSSIHLAAWLIACTAGADEAAEAIRYVAPVGEKEAWVSRTMARVLPQVPSPQSMAPG